MNQPSLRCTVLSDFNASNFGALLRHDPNGPSLEVLETPYGSVMQMLTDPTRFLPEEKIDVAFVWTRLEAISPAFGRLLQGEGTNSDAVLEEVDNFASLILKLRGKARFVLVPSWTLPPDRKNFSLISFNNPAGWDRLLLRANLRLADVLEGQSGLCLLNAQNWIARVGKAAYNSKLWYLSKIPFSNALSKEAMSETKSALAGLLGRSRKILVLDLDDTLWGGIVGDDGWQNLSLGGHDAIGEAFVDFQRELKALSRRGVLLAIVSKNDEAIALEAIDKHPEMLLRREDFVAWRINWNDKAANLEELVRSVNLGLDSAVFIDDNPSERARVRETLPEVLVPDWPEDKTQYVTVLRELSCFNAISVTEEDRSRTSSYATERQRQGSLDAAGSMDEWLQTLGLVVEVAELSSLNLPRAAQLLNKTNQMNLQTRRMSEEEFAAWSEEPDCKVWTFRVRDRFGDYGLTGLASLKVAGHEAFVADFLLSCRVFGKNVEDAIFATLVSEARFMGATALTAIYVPTPKNNPCLQFLERSGLRHSANGLMFSWNTDDEFEMPGHIRLGRISTEPAGHWGVEGLNRIKSRNIVSSKQ
jgi:FkbH-like protein